MAASRSTRTSKLFAPTGTCCLSVGPFPSSKSCSRNGLRCYGQHVVRSHAASDAPPDLRTPQPTSPTDQPRAASPPMAAGLVAVLTCCCPPAGSGSSDDLAADDARLVHQPTLDHYLQPPPGDRSGERQDEEEADDVGQKTRSQQQGATDQHERRVGQLTPGHPASVQGRPQRLPGATAFTLDQIGTEGRLHQQQRNGLPTADH